MRTALFIFKVLFPLFWGLAVGKVEAREPAGLTWLQPTNRLSVAQMLTNVVVRFNYTNTSSDAVIIRSIEASCHCTTPRISALPWTIAPHEKGGLDVVVDIPGKWGMLEKTLELRGDVITNLLTIQVEIPEPDVRAKNRLVAFTDRQAVFKGDCAHCHAKPSVGLEGEELYRSACGICHEAKHRASMVPDLATKLNGDPNYWSQWIRLGKPGTFMPAFGNPHGGPLNEAQIASLVQLLSKRAPAASVEKTALDLK